MCGDDMKGKYSGITLNHTAVLKFFKASTSGISSLV